MTAIIPVIMAGGSGTRLWPLSRSIYPKQFINLCDDKLTMLQATVKRLQGIEDCESPILVCNEVHRFLAAEQLNQIDSNHNGLILEPIGRNTAPAIAVAAFHALAQGEGDPILLILAADHDIKDNEIFCRTAELAVAEAKGGKLVTFGISPESAHTGYGYIKSGEPSSEVAYKIKEFKEKPSFEKAQFYLKSGEYFWNSGMFAFSAQTYLSELEKFSPDIYGASKKSYETAQEDLDFIRLDKEVFASCPSDSIDYAVMEKTDKAVVIPMQAGWSDVGSWQSLYEGSKKDINDNVLNGDVICEDTSGTYIHSGSRLVTGLGLRDLFIVDTPSALLVGARDKVNEMKNLIKGLQIEDREELETHLEVHRPWGTYKTIDEGKSFKVKHIVVKPGAKLSTQYHHHRAEHWVIVSGTAEVRVGGEIKILRANESTYIPIGDIHFLKNIGKVPLQLIEVQTGEYLGEDDITRLEDQYGRTQ